MSEQTIYQTLRKGGLSRAGALGMMGNMGWESGFHPNNVENRCPLSDEDYTSNVNAGRIPREEFIRDAYGYGLCQWTYSSRKAGLYDLAKKKGVSIADEATQLEYCLTELKSGEYAALYSFLCETTDMLQATDKICRFYERPAVNNVGDRYKIACECANKPYDSDISDPEPAPQPEPAVPDYGSTDSCSLTVRILRKGDRGNDVRNLQLILKDRGYDVGSYGIDGVLGTDTEKAINKFRTDSNLDPDGTADEAVWQILFQ